MEWLTASRDNTVRGCLSADDLLPYADIADELLRDQGPQMQLELYMLTLHEKCWHHAVRGVPRAAWTVRHDEALHGRSLVSENQRRGSERSRR